MLTLKPHRVYSIRLLTRSLACCSSSPRKPEKLVTVEGCWKHKNKIASDKFKAMWGTSLAYWGAPHLNFWASNGREICWVLISTGASALFQIIPEGHIAGNRMLWRKVFACSFDLGNFWWCHLFFGRCCHIKFVQSGWGQLLPCLSHVIECPVTSAH